MKITVENAGTLAQIYSVGLLILAVEGRFLWEARRPVPPWQLGTGKPGRHG